MPRKSTATTLEAGSAAASVAPTKQTRKKRKWTRRTPVAAKSAGGGVPSMGTSQRFAVFDNGDVSINSESCKGTLSRAEMAALVEFHGRVGPAPVTRLEEGSGAPATIDESLARSGPRRRRRGKRSAKKS